MSLELSSFANKERIVTEYVQTIKDMVNEQYYTTGQIVTSFGKVSKYDVQKSIMDHEIALENNYKLPSSDDIADKILSQAGITSHIDNTIKHQLESIFTHQHLDLLKHMQRLIDKNANRYEPENSSMPVAPTGITFNDLYKLFLKEKENNKSKTSATAYRDYSSAYDDFVFVLDCQDKDIAHFTREDFGQFSDALLKLPSRRTIKARYRDLTFQQISKIKIPKEDLLAYNSRVKKLQNVKLFFDIATNKRHKYLTENIAEDFLIPMAKTKKEQDNPKYPLTQENLEKLFNSKLFTKKLDLMLSIKPEKIWIPLLALFTGMRENEICQLHITDIKSDDFIIDGVKQKIHFIDINEDKEKRLKNDNAIRLIPIHQNLVDAGFLEYVKTRKQGYQLFSNLRYNKNAEKYNVEYGKSFMSYFRRYITKDPTQVFHSFRHSTGDKLIKNTAMHKVPKDVVNRLMGHERPRDMTSTTYSGGFTPLELNEGIKTLSFDLASLHAVLQEMQIFYKI